MRWFTWLLASAAVVGGASAVTVWLNPQVLLSPAVRTAGPAVINQVLARHAVRLIPNGRPVNEPVVIAPAVAPGERATARAVCTAIAQSLPARFTLDARTMSAIPVPVRSLLDKATGQSVSVGSVTVTGASGSTADGTATVQVVAHAASGTYTITGTVIVSHQQLVALQSARLTHSP